MRLIARREALNFEPGSEFLYSNSGYVLLSLVVKRASGKNLNDDARENTFAPLEMKSTLFPACSIRTAAMEGFGYERRNGVGMPRTACWMWWGMELRSSEGR